MTSSLWTHFLAGLGLDPPRTTHREDRESGKREALKWKITLVHSQPIPFHAPLGIQKHGPDSLDCSQTASEIRRHRTCLVPTNQMVQFW